MRALVVARRIWFGEEQLATTDASEVAERFLRLAGRELDRAYRLAGMLLSDRAEAEDATQEALLRAWRSAGSLRDPTGFQAWFDRILINVCRDRLRRRRRVPSVAFHLWMSPVARDPFHELLDRDETLRAIGILDDDQRLVVVLHYWSDLTLAAIAERTGWPIGTVKSRLHHALRRMEAHLAGIAAAEHQP
jgi:RNA polymerase sigma-70 factor (ECF subfamily)